MEILEIIDEIMMFLICVAPLFIWHKLSEILKEIKRHNKAVEVKIDIIHDILNEPQEEAY